MKSRLLPLYHRLPPFFQSVAATLWGFYLRPWRYGPRHEQRVEEALERDAWSTAQWKNYQEEQLAYILHQAATQVPYYRDQWAERRRKGDRTAWDVLENWSILTKEPIRRHPRQFLVDDSDPRTMYYDATSGTHGIPLDIWWSREASRQYYAIHEARLRRWYAVSSRQRWAILGGQLVIPVERSRPPFWVWNAAMNQLYISSAHISPHSTPTIIEAMHRYRVTHLVTYTSSAVYLAQQAIEQGLSPPAFKVIITNAEGVSPWQREAIEQGLGGIVCESYGMAELVAAASQDPDGQLRIWPEVGYIEVVSDDGDPLPVQTTGQLICTSLLNDYMPLIRYQVGDRGAMGVTPERGLPVLQHIEGRQWDLLVARDGRRIYSIDPIFYGMPIYLAQIVQDQEGHILIKLIPAEGFNDEHRQEMLERLRVRMGDIPTTIKTVEHIKGGAAGKFKPVISHYDPQKNAL